MQIFKFIVGSVATWACLHTECPGLGQWFIVIMFKAVQITQIPTPWVGKSGWSVISTIHL